MYLQEINIQNFRVLKDIAIHFQPPNGKTSNKDTGNVVNIIAGVNGCGKTSLLEAIFLAISNPDDFVVHEKYGTFSIVDEGEVEFCDSLNKLSCKIYSRDKIYSKENLQLLFLPMQQSFDYRAVSQLQNTYQFAQRIDPSTTLGNAELYIKEYIVGLERRSSISNPKERTQNAINTFNQCFLDAELLTKLFDLSEKEYNRPIFKNASNQEVTIDQLSDGEKQLYARVIALMMLEPQDSIILIDEPEISLHPAWQQRIMKIYSRIGKNNQFIVATHSPQIIANEHYKNRILLVKENNKIKPIHCANPPSGIDVNTILSEIMGADPVPPKILELYRNYRGLIESHQENSEEGIRLKKELLEIEGENSSFMQEMAFFIELRE